MKFDKVQMIDHLTINAPNFSVSSNNILPDVAMPNLTWNVKNYTLRCKQLKVYKKIDISKPIDLISGFKVDDLVLYTNGIFSTQKKRQFKM